jgi:type IVB pilus formation R64 PilN family outer membrane protein
MKFLIRTVLFSFIATGLSACTTAPQSAESQVDYANTRAKMQAMTAPATPSQRIAVSRVKSAPSLPADFEDTVTLNRGDISSLDDLARRLSRISGMPVRLSREVEEFVSSRKTGKSDINRPPIVNPNAQTISFADESSFFGMTYAGTKKGLFDAVAARLGCYWRFDKGTIQIYLTDTKTFFIPALPGSSSAKDTSKGSDGTSSSGVRSELEVTSVHSIWGDLEKTVRSMITTSGRVVIAPANGAIIVTDTPDALERVGKFIDEQKRFLSRQVSLEVQVFNLTLSDESSFGIDLNLAMNHLNKYGISLTSSAGQSAAGGGSSAFSMSVLDTATGEASKWRGSSVILNALQGQGSVSNFRTANLVSLNNHAVPLRIGRTVGYLQQSSTSTTANVGTATALTPGTISEGYSLNLIPTILEDDQVMLQLTMNITQLRQLRSLISGTSKIEFPETEEANTIQRTIMRHGETLLLAGFEQDTKSASDNVGFFSVGTRGGRGRTLLVLLVTPSINARK